jgi:hypothetical protein
METECTSADPSDTPKLFLHVRFEVPTTASPAGCDGMDDSNDDDGACDAGVSTTESSVVITEQHFDLSNCETAVIGLPDGLEPVKVCCVCVCACACACVRVCFALEVGASQTIPRDICMVSITHPDQKRYFLIPPSEYCPTKARAGRLRLLGYARPRTVATPEGGWTIRRYHRSRTRGEGCIGCVPHGFDREGEGGDEDGDPGGGRGW